MLGGTLFVGRHLTAALLAAGHDVTLFNRGRTNPGLFPNAHHVVGDRDPAEPPGFANLRGEWDAVVDVNGYDPANVAALVEVLAEPDRYVYVSTGAVYDIPFPTGGDETAPVRHDDTYGGLKHQCEEVVRRRYADKALVLRLGLQCGPHDPTDRISYWVHRIARGGQVLVPAPPDRAFSTIDTRDVAAFTVDALATGLTGTYNTTGAVIDWRTWVEGCAAATGGHATFTWVDDPEFLLAHAPDQQHPWNCYPMAMPPDWGDWWSCSSARAEAEGLAYRPLADTIADIHAWLRTRPAGHRWRAGLAPAAERRILTAASTR